MNLSVLIGLAMYTLIGYACGAEYEAIKQKGDPDQIKSVKKILTVIFLILSVVAAQFAKLWW